MPDKRRTFVHVPLFRCRQCSLPLIVARENSYFAREVMVAVDSICLVRVAGLESLSGSPLGRTLGTSIS